MSLNLNSAAAVIGIDIGKNSFHVVSLRQDRVNTSQLPHSVRQVLTVYTRHGHYPSTTAITLCQPLDLVGHDFNSFIERWCARGRKPGLSEGWPITVLFRHPFRIPIPHTATLPRCFTHSIPTKTIINLRHEGNVGGSHRRRRADEARRKSGCSMTTGTQ